jgi:hypothetical protein
MNHNEPDIFEKIGALLSKDPHNFGWFVLGVGVFILVASIFNWNWIFEGRSVNLQKIEGIANIFGRNAARVYFGLVGIACIVAGIIVLII